MKLRGLGGGGHIFGEPGELASGAVGDVGGVAEAVAFVGVDDELRFDAFRAEGVPELKGLRSRALAVAIADDNQGGRGDLLDELNGRGFGVNGGIVVDGGAEERGHPLIDGVFRRSSFSSRRCRRRRRRRGSDGSG